MGTAALQKQDVGRECLLKCNATNAYELVVQLLYLGWTASFAEHPVLQVCLVACSVDTAELGHLDHVLSL